MSFVPGIVPFRYTVEAILEAKYKRIDAILSKIRLNQNSTTPIFLSREAKIEMHAWKYKML